MPQFNFEDVANHIFNGCDELMDPLSDTQMLAVRASLFGVQRYLDSDSEIEQDLESMSDYGL